MRFINRHLWHFSFCLSLVISITTNQAFAQTTAITCESTIDMVARETVRVGQYVYAVGNNGTSDFVILDMCDRAGCDLTNPVQIWSSGQKGNGRGMSRSGGLIATIGSDYVGIPGTWKLNFYLAKSLAVPGTGPQLASTIFFSRTAESYPLALSGGFISPTKYVAIALLQNYMSPQYSTEVRAYVWDLTDPKNPQPLSDTVLTAPGFFSDEDISLSKDNFDALYCSFRGTYAFCPGSMYRDVIFSINFAKLGNPVVTYSDPTVGQRMGNEFNDTGWGTRVLLRGTNLYLERLEHGPDTLCTWSIANPAQPKFSDCIEVNGGTGSEGTAIAVALGGKHMYVYAATGVNPILSLANPLKPAFIALDQRPAFCSEAKYTKAFHPSCHLQLPSAQQNPIDPYLRNNWSFLVTMYRNAANQLIMYSSSFGAKGTRGVIRSWDITNPLKPAQVGLSPHCAGK